MIKKICNAILHGKQRLLCDKLQIRFYSEAILDTEITSHISLASLEREILKNYGAIHFRMEESAAVSSLTNSGYLSSPIAQLSGGTFVTVN